MARTLHADGEAATKLKIPEGRKDDTHFVAAGAAKVTEFAAAQIRRQNPPLAKWLR